MKSHRQSYALYLSKPHVYTLNNKLVYAASCVYGMKIQLFYNFRRLTENEWPTQYTIYKWKWGGWVGRFSALFSDIAFTRLIMVTKLYNQIVIHVKFFGY